MSLRPYQDGIIDETRALMTAGDKSILITSPTGSGKTLLTAHMLKTAAAKGVSSFFTVHRRELVKQSIRAFDSVGIRFGVIAAGFQEDRRALVQIASVATLARRLHLYAPPKLVVWDECHHVAAKSWADIHKALPRAFHVGLTATPARLDGKGLGAFYKRMVKGPSTRWLIENGYLSPYRIFAPPGVSTAGIHKRAGDFARDELAAAADRPTITGDAIKHYLRLAEGKRAVAFCVTIEHSKHVVERFNAAGITAEHVDGETSTEDRDAAIERFRSGHTLVLSNVELFGEGFDLPSIEAAILLRPTQSLGLYLQQVGRSLRPSEGKETAIILDHAGNVQLHGLPDEEREWSLDGGAGKPKNIGESAPVKVCPKCFAAQFSGRPACQYCGHVFEIKATRVVEEIAGELSEIDIKAARRVVVREQAHADSFEALVELGRKRGYRRPFLWAKHVSNARAAKKRAGL